MISSLCKDDRVNHRCLYLIGKRILSKHIYNKFFDFLFSSSPVNEETESTCPGRGGLIL